MSVNEATRTLIEMSLRVRSLAATVALFKQTMTNVTEREINGIRHRMVARGELTAADPAPNHCVDHEPVDPGPELRARRMSGEQGSRDLHNATLAMFQRKADLHRVSLDGARLATLYSHEELKRMSRVGLEG